MIVVSVIRSGVTRECCDFVFCCFFFQAEDGIRDLVRSRGLGDVYKRQLPARARFEPGVHRPRHIEHDLEVARRWFVALLPDCLLYTSDAADDLLCVDLGGRRIIKKKKPQTN